MTRSSRSQVAEQFEVKTHNVATVTHQDSLRLVASLAFASLLGGCIPFGDCWPSVEANVTVSAKFGDHIGAPIVVLLASRIYDTDVSGVDHQGIPVTSRGLVPIASGPPSTTASFEFRGYPYPVWYVAFLDLNENKSLDIGEPFGVDLLNPRDSGCEPHITTIEINSIRT